MVETALHNLPQHLGHCSFADLSPSHKPSLISSKAEDRAAKMHSSATPHSLVPKEGVLPFAGHMGFWDEGP